MNKDNRIEPTIGTREEQMIALANDPAIDPPMDPNACVCFDDAGNPLNQCDECPR